VTATEPVLRHPAGERLPQPRPASEAELDTSTPGLRIEVQRPRPGTAVVAAHGEVDMLTAPWLAGMLTVRLRHDTLELLVLDLSGLDFLGAAGLSVLVQTHLQARRRGTGLRIVTGDSRPVVRALTAAGMHHDLPLSPTVAAAQALTKEV